MALLPSLVVIVIGPEIAPLGILQTINSFDQFSLRISTTSI